MFIASFQLRNYKSFLDSQELKLFQGINLVVGQNNSGKSALLEGLSLTFENKPYRDSTQKTTANERREQESNAIVSFTVEREELWGILREIPGQFLVPLPEDNIRIDVAFRNQPEENGVGPYMERLLANQEVEGARIWIEDLLERPDFVFQVYYKTKEKPSLAHIPQNLSGANLPIFPILQNCTSAGSRDKRIYAACHIGDDGLLIIANEDKLVDFTDRPDEDPFETRKPQLQSGPDNLDFGLRVVEQLRQRIYFFQAQRTAQGKCKQEDVCELKKDASNLASFIDKLKSTPARLRELNEKLRIVLPQIYVVGTKDLPPENYTGIGEQRGFHEILVYQDEGRNEDTAVSLEDSGTGVGQVLAILSIIIASNHSQTIIIDEPQSFLHPGAVRKLIDVLKQYPQHQYIISTHSPQLITASNPSTITLITKEPGAPSVLKSITPSEQDDLTLCLENVGTRLSDVFGADQVLWVEGPTEVNCFPLIVEKLLKRPLLGTAIVNVTATGDLEGKDADRVIKIYERLSEGAGLIPRTLGFIFDKENRSEKKIEDLKRRLGGNRVRFLDRTMTENYFLNAQAIVSVIQGLGGNPSVEEVEKYLKTRLDKENLNVEEAKRYYFGEGGKDKQSIEIIHAAHCLEDLFISYAPAGINYEKAKHGKMLTEWLIENRPDDLNELKMLLEKAMNQS